MLPLMKDFPQRSVCYLSAIRRIGRFESSRYLQILRNPPFYGHCEELGITPRETQSSRYKKHRGATWSETTNSIRSRMPGEPLGDSTFNRNNINIRVTIIVSTECYKASIWRKGRNRFRTLSSGQTPNSCSIDVSHPEITGISKSNMGLADRRLTQELCVFDIYSTR